MSVQAVDHRGSPKERVVRDVIRGLYEGRYRPGERLIEAQLTRHYGVSRGPVREALNHLAATGVVELTPQRGAQMRLLSIKEAIDILVVLTGLIGIAARLAAKNITSLGATERLEAALAHLVSFDPNSDTASYAMARDLFYQSLTNTADNSELRRVLPTIQIHIVRVQFRSILRDIDRQRHADYIQIAHAILAGQPSVAAAAARAHIQRSIDALSPFSDAVPQRNGLDTRTEW